MESFNVSEFKAICLRLLERIRQTGQPIQVLKNGEPLVVVYPAPSKNRKQTFGALKESLNGAPADLTAPLEGVEWEASDK